jgi:hypothetical protein
MQNTNGAQSNIEKEMASYEKTMDAFKQNTTNMHHAMKQM